MNKRIIYVSRPVHLSIRYEQLVIKTKEPEAEHIYPPAEIAYLEIDTPQVTLTGAVLQTLMCHDVVVSICDEKHLPSGMCVPLVGHSLQQKHQRAQLNANLPLKKRLWMQTVRAKILNQARALELANQPAQRLHQLASKVRSGDPDNYEAQAATYYWPRIFDDPDFQREPAGASPNDLLNYGYAVLRALIARALVMAGLLPAAGIYHSNQYNPYPLADDVMEPFRPLVDLWVLRWWRENLPPITLTREIKAYMLQLPQLSLHHRGRHPDLLTTAASVCQSLARCYLNEQKTIDYPELCPSILTESCGSS